MKAFIDTSSLIKKYIVEKGSDAFDEILETVSEIIVAPVYALEINSAIERRLSDKTLTSKQAAWLKKEIKKDLNYFSRIKWTRDLEEKAIELIRKHQIKTLDSIQLASGILSGSDIFISSDKKLFTSAFKELKKTVFV